MEAEAVALRSFWHHKRMLVRRQPLTIHLPEVKVRSQDWFRGNDGHPEEGYSYVVAVESTCSVYGDHWSAVVTALEGNAGVNESDDDVHCRCSPATPWPFLP